MDAIQQIHRKLGRAAFLIGNGPNLAARIFPSWKDLLTNAADRPLSLPIDGLTNTEVYDLVELNSSDFTQVKKRVVAQLSLLPSYNLDVHRKLMTFAKDTASPVLTTNFDAAFESAIGAKPFHLDSKSFTRFYPWKSYYGFEAITNPTDGFGIWKVHGDVRYKDSIRLGLSDYMGSVQKARQIIHQGSGSLFRGKDIADWGGRETWLYIWFNMPIIIFGFGFGIDEVFLRWLLIERKRYFNQKGKPMDLYYVCKDMPSPSALNLLVHLGVQVVTVGSYAEMY